MKLPCHVELSMWEEEVWNGFDIEQVTSGYVVKQVKYDQFF